MSIAQKILANPAKYSLQQLQQGVENGIIPAYIAIPLIQEKVQQEKMAQQSMQGMQDPQGQQQQMPIAQAVMQEAQGLSTLPTNLPQSYAGGGIVAFADGGDVERYQSGGASNKYETMYDRYTRQVREQEERERQARAAMTPEQQLRADRAAMAAPLAAAGDIVGGPYNYLAQTGSSLANALGVPRMGRALGIYDPDVTSVRIPQIGQGGNTPFTDMTRRYAAGQDAAAPAPAATPPAAPVVAAPPSPAKEKPSAGQGIKTPGAGTGITGLGAGLGGTGRPVMKAPEGVSYETMAKDYFNQYGKESAERDTALDAKVNAEREKVKGQAFEEYKGMLQKEAEESGANKNQAKYMAMFKAGLAMMAGTSRNAFENIGKGAMVGAEDYQAAVKDLKKAERERTKELANIEQARRAEALGDRDTAIKRLDAARDRADARTRYVGEGIYKATGLDKNQAFELAKTQFSSDSDIFRTNLAGQYQLAGQRIGAEATVAAANARAARSEGITPYQLARLRQDAEKQVDPNAIRAQLVQQLKLSKPPKPGADPTFEQRFQQAYEAAIMDRVNRSLGYGGASGAQEANPLDSLLDKYAPKK
jgi:hypothetical protein